MEAISRSCLPAAAARTKRQRKATCRGVLGAASHRTTCSRSSAAKLTSGLILAMRTHISYWPQYVYLFMIHTTSQSQTKNDMNGILSWPETRPYAFDPWCDVFCESLAEFLRECVLGLLFLAFSFSGSPVRTGRNPCLRFQESTDLAMPWSTNQGSQRCARRPTRRLPSPRDYAD